MAIQVPIKEPVPEAVTEVYRAERLSARSTFLESPLIKSSAPVPRRVILMARREIWVPDVGVTDNRSCSHVREHSAVHSVGEKASGRLLFFHVDIQNIRKILEGVKGKSDGKGQLRIGQPKSCDSVDGVQKKSPVFEKSQYQKIDHNCKDQVLFSVQCGLFGISQLFSSSS